MKYLGGKHQIGEKISNFIIKDSKKTTFDTYLEPFCGSLGVFKHMTNKGFKKCIASDIQPDIIKLWNEVKMEKLKIPSKISEKKYHEYKKLKSPNSLKAIAGFGLSYGGKYFSGYSQNAVGNSNRNFLSEFKNSIESIRPLIKNAEFYNKSYKDWNPKKMVIYCDPPYKNTEKYGAVADFDHSEFWDIMRDWSRYNAVYISEETAPKDFVSVWSIKKRRTLDSNNRFYRIEKLFVYNPIKSKTRKQKTLYSKNPKTKRRRIHAGLAAHRS